MTLALGLRDRAVPPEGARARRRRGCAHARIVEYPDLGHLMHEEAPDRIATLIVEAAAEPTPTKAAR